MEIFVDVIYEMMPTFCYGCNTIGYNMIQCRQRSLKVKPSFGEKQGSSFNPSSFGREMQQVHAWKGIRNKEQGPSNALTA